MYPAQAAHFENVRQGLEIPLEKSAAIAKESACASAVRVSRGGGKVGRRERFLPQEQTSKVQTRADDKGIYLCKSNQRGLTNKNGGALFQEILKTCVAAKGLACCLRRPVHASNVRVREEKK